LVILLVSPVYGVGLVVSPPVPWSSRQNILFYPNIQVLPVGIFLKFACSRLPRFGRANDPDILPLAMTSAFTLIEVRISVF
jgi:hypothetical protein